MFFLSVGLMGYYLQTEEQRIRSLIHSISGGASIGFPEITQKLIAHAHDRHGTPSFLRMKIGASALKNLRPYTPR